MKSHNYNFQNNTKYVSLNPSSDKDIRNYPEQDDEESRLHTLYPGRPMSKYFNINGDNIPNEGGDEAAFEMLDNKTKERERYNNRLQKTLLAGPNPIDDPTNPKMLMQPAVDPYEMIDDPQARFQNLENPPIINDALPIPVGDGSMIPLKEGFQSLTKEEDDKSSNKYLFFGIILLIIFAFIAIKYLRK